MQPNKKDTDDIEFLPANGDNGRLINQTIIQILVEQDNSDEIKDLMQSELDYNRKRLQILREHHKLHPDAIEERKSKRFRRTQYGVLMFFVPCLLASIYFAPMAIALALSTIVMIIVAGVVLNGRDRDNDSEALLSILSKLIKRSQ